MPAADHDASPLLGGKPPPPPPTTSSPPRRSASGRTGAPAPRAPPAPGADDGGDGWPAARGEAKALAALAAPLVASSVASYAVSIVQAVFVGRLGRRELSVAVLATSFFNVTGLSFLTGSLGALETLAAQAHGRGDAAAVCAALQRAVLLTGALAAAVAAAWTGIEALMVALGQDPGLAAAAARFLHLSTPALLLVSLAEALKRWLMVQGSVAPAAAAAAAAAVAAPFFCWLLVYRLRLGLDGAALAGVAAQATQLAVLLAAAARREAAARAAGAPPSWRGWSADALRGWGEYMRLALPSAAVVCLEWWAFEACVMLAGLLEDPDLNVAVMGLCLSLSALAYMIPLGLGSAVSARVGNALGAGRPLAARRAARVGTAAAATSQGVLAAAALAARCSLGFAFTADPVVAAAAAPVVAVMAVCMVGDGINAVLGGALRGAGRQALGAALYVASFWAVGLPAAAALAFKARLGVVGLWTGLALAATLNAGVMLWYFAARLSWRREAKRAAAVAAAAGGGDLAVGGDIEFAQSGPLPAEALAPPLERMP